MHFFDATHTSVNTLPASVPESKQQPIARHVKKVKTETKAAPVAAVAEVLPFSLIARALLVLDPHRQFSSILLCVYTASGASASSMQCLLYIIVAQ